MSELTDCINSLTAKDIIRSVAKTANGVPFYLQVEGGGFCAEFQAVRDAYVGTIPDAIQLAAQNTMACGLVEDGVWAKMDTFWVMANGDSPNCDLNWINPGTFTLAPVNAPTFQAWEGYTGNGTNEYLNTGWDPTNNGVNYVQNSASIGIYIRTNVAESKTDIGARSVGGRVQINTRIIGDFKQLFGPNDLALLSDANADSRGMFIGTRTAANARTLYKNKVGNSDAQASSGLYVDDLYILANNNFGAAATLSTKQVSMAFTGSGFTQADVNNMTDRFETYMDFLGKGVIP